MIDINYYICEIKKNHVREKIEKKETSQEIIH
jgi:hypothetical protein